MHENGSKSANWYGSIIFCTKIPFDIYLRFLKEAQKNRVGNMFKNGPKNTPHHHLAIKTNFCYSCYCSCEINVFKVRNKKVYQVFVTLSFDDVLLICFCIWNKGFLFCCRLNINGKRVTLKYRYLLRTIELVFDI